MFFLYPGFGKTGTTTLQEHLLSRHKDIIYFGRPFTYSESISEFNREIRKPEGYFDGQKFKKLSESCRNEAKEGKTVMISDATLINNYYMRGILAKRLHDAFPDAYIIFTIRNQLSAVKSYYANHGRLLRKVPAPFTGRYVSFDNWLSYSLQTWETSYPGLIDYYTSLRIYEKIFGKEKVKVFLFEEFVKNKKKFIDTLSRHLSINSDEAFYLIEGKKSNPRDSGALIKWISIARIKF